jgi:hypothetical protein
MNKQGIETPLSNTIGIDDAVTTILQKIDKEGAREHWFIGFHQERDPKTATVTKEVLYTQDWDDSLKRLGRDNDLTCEVIDAKWYGVDCVIVNIHKRDFTFTKGLSSQKNPLASAFDHETHNLEFYVCFTPLDAERFIKSMKERTASWMKLENREYHE